MGKRKLELGVVELLDGDPLAVLGANDGVLDDLDASPARAVTSRHLVVHLVYSVHESRRPELLAHVVGARPGVVPKPDGVVLDSARVLFRDLVHRQNFTSRLLHLPVLVKKVPEAGASRNFVGRKDLHPVQLGRGLRVRGGLAANHVVVAHRHLCK